MNWELVVAVLTVLFGSGFLFALWNQRRRINIEVEHRAAGLDYAVVVIVNNGGAADEHVSEISLVPTSSVEATEGKTWASQGLSDQVDHDLPARGRPVREPFNLPVEWLEQGARFRVEVKLSSRRRTFRSKKQSLNQGVLSAIEWTSLRR